MEETTPVWKSVVDTYRDSYIQFPTIAKWSFLHTLRVLQDANNCEDCGRDSSSGDEIEYAYEVSRYLCDTCYDKRGLSE